MARGLNKVMLIGNLGKDAETRQAGSATVTNFSLATARSVKNGQTGEWRDETDWHDVVLWRGENVAQYLTKGTQVYIEGRLQTRSWEGNDGQKKYRTEVVCDGPSGLILLGGNRDGQHQSQSTARAPQSTASDDDLGVDSGDIPF